MEGLIKGLIDVALGNDHNNQDNNNNNDDDDRQSRDERSRSSWAEVVSGDQDADDHRNPHSQVS
jgi:poly(U)-specific endoribonuclease